MAAIEKLALQHGLCVLEALDQMTGERVSPERARAWPTTPEGITLGRVSGADDETVVTPGLIITAGVVTAETVPAIRGAFGDEETEEVVVVGCPAVVRHGLLMVRDHKFRDVVMAPEVVEASGLEQFLDFLRQVGKESYINAVS